MGDHLCFFFNDTATTEIYTLSLHDALPIWVELGGQLLPAQWRGHRGAVPRPHGVGAGDRLPAAVLQVVHVHRPLRPRPQDRKSTRLNSSHANISYAVFCLKKNKFHAFSSVL